MQLSHRAAQKPAIMFKADQATEYVILFWLTFHLLGGRA